MKVLHQDRSVKIYQEKKDSEKLISDNIPFLNKFKKLFKLNSINFSDSGVRLFLCCHIKERKIRRKLKREGPYSIKTREAAYEALSLIRYRIRNLNEEELINELIIILLICAGRYKDKGFGFRSYLQKAYHYQLKRNLDAIQIDILDQKDLMHWDSDLEDSNYQTTDAYDDEVEVNEQSKLNDPAWIHGNISKWPINELKSHERYIMVQYYFKKNNDKQISRKLPYHPKSICRIRQRVKRNFYDLYEKGELKWVRLQRI